MPSDSANAGIGCMTCARQALNVPSDSIKTEIGCMICARQAFRVPSDSAQTEDGCRASTRQAFACHPIWRQAKKDGKSARKVSEKCQKCARKRTGKL